MILASTLVSQVTVCFTVTEQWLDCQTSHFHD